MKPAGLYTLFIVINLLFSAGCKRNQQQITILENGSYFNGTEFTAFAEIIIRDSIILSVNSKKSNILGKRIDLSGKYVIPGLVDAHVHLSGSPTGKYVVTTAENNSHSSLLCG